MIPIGASSPKKMSCYFEAPLKLHELFKPKSASSIHFEYSERDFDINISMESEQKIIDLREKILARREIQKEQRKKRDNNTKVYRMIREYKELYEEVNKKPCSDKLDIPKNDDDIKNLCLRLQFHIGDLKTIKDERDKNEQISIELAEKIAKQSSPINKAKPITYPPNADKKVIEFIETVKSIYNNTLDYALAEVLMAESKNDINIAINAYMIQMNMNVTFICGEKSFNQVLQANAKISELISIIKTQFSVPYTKKVQIRPNSNTAPIIDESMMNQPISMLGERGELLIIVELI